MFRSMVDQSRVPPTPPDDANEGRGKLIPNLSYNRDEVLIDVVPARMYRGVAIRQSFSSGKDYVTIPVDQLPELVEDLIGLLKIIKEEDKDV
jgi:hypothetical protein